MDILVKSSMFNYYKNQFYSWTKQLFAYGQSKRFAGGWTDRLWKSIFVGRFLKRSAYENICIPKILGNFKILRVRADSKASNPFNKFTKSSNTFNKIHHKSTQTTKYSWPSLLTPVSPTTPLLVEATATHENEDGQQGNHAPKDGPRAAGGRSPKGTRWRIRVPDTCPRPLDGRSRHHHHCRHGRWQIRAPEAQQQIHAPEAARRRIQAPFPSSSWPSLASRPAVDQGADTAVIAAGGGSMRPGASRIYE